MVRRSLSLFTPRAGGMVAAEGAAAARDLGGSYAPAGGLRSPAGPPPEWSQRAGIGQRAVVPAVGARYSSPVLGGGAAERTDRKRS